MTSPNGWSSARPRPAPTSAARWSSSGRGTGPNSSSSPTSPAWSTPDGYCYRAALGRRPDGWMLRMPRYGKDPRMSEPVETRGDERHEMLAVDTDNDGQA